VAVSPAQLALFQELATQVKSLSRAHYGVHSPQSEADDAQLEAALRAVLAEVASKPRDPNK
jgi:hypothetical protein